jgi:hypothetical protein
MNNETRSLIINCLGAVIITYMLLFRAFRELDAIGLGVAMLACLLVIFIAKQVRLFSNLLPFYLFSTFILLVSWFDGMPDSWTRYQNPLAALRQWAWLPVLTLTASAIFVLLCENWRWITRNALWIAVALFVITRLSKLALGQLDNVNLQFFIYGLDNENAAIAALIFIHMHYNSKTVLRALVVGLLYLAMCSSQSSLMAGVISILALWPRLHKPLIVAIAIGGLLFIGIAQVFFREIILIDPNSSFRGLIWRDSTQLLKDTLGIGVGYGTEYIKNDFRSIDAEFNRFILESAGDRLFIGTHSSLYDVAIRTGVIGAVLLLIGLSRELRGHIANQRLANLRVAMVGSLLFNNLFNMGLASINVTMGTAMFFAIAIFCVDGRPLSRSDNRPRVANMPNRTAYG